MSLSCYCDLDNCAWYYTRAWLDKPMPTLSRRKRCCSCGQFINPGDACTKYHRGRPADSDIEERIYGCCTMAVPLAPLYQCETCSDLMENLAELGFDCVTPDEDMRKLIEEYQYEYMGVDA